MILNCLFVGLGGFAGSVLRYLCNFLRFEGISFPIITLGINILGSFAIMFFAGVLTRSFPVEHHLMLFLRVGLCGGFTTFSTFSAETLGLFESGDHISAIVYAVASVVLCVLGAWLGSVASAAIAK